MAKPVLIVEGVAKKFARELKSSLRYGLIDACREIVGRNRVPALRQGEFWAVHDVSFTVQEGGALGLIGANGSGKTTLLRVISGLIRMDRGTVRVRGRVAPLIALGAGFNPVLTGRENIFVNMAILGLRENEIRSRFDEVVSFAELEDAIDSPVRTYSSGMAARLGFACAIHTKPDLLLIDEVLSVGDMHFRAKCYRRLAQLKSEGVAFLLVSHAINTVLSLCDSVLYLSKGVQRRLGDPAEVVAQYEADTLDSRAASTGTHLVLDEKSEANSTGVDITEIFVAGPDGRPATQLFTGDPGSLCIGYRARRPTRQVGVQTLIRELALEMELVLNLNSERDGISFDLDATRGTIRIDFPVCSLRPGLYVAKILLVSGDYYMFDAVESYRFSVGTRRPFVQSKFHQPRNWSEESRTLASAGR